MAETSSLDREFTITRVFDAPRELVWKAWTDPEQVASWFGPRGISTPRSTITMDVRPGGTFELTMVSDDDGTEYRPVARSSRSSSPSGLCGATATST